MEEASEASARSNTPTYISPISISGNDERVIRDEMFRSFVRYRSWQRKNKYPTLKKLSPAVVVVVVVIISHDWTTSETNARRARRYSARENIRESVRDRLDILLRIASDCLASISNANTPG